MTEIDPHFGRPYLVAPTAIVEDHGYPLISVEPSDECARYWGSDGRLCSTHLGRFTSEPTASGFSNRCDRADKAPTVDSIKHDVNITFDKFDPERLATAMDGIMADYFASGSQQAFAWWAAPIVIERYEAGGIH